MGEIDRCAVQRRFAALDAAYKRGDLTALRQALGDPEGFPNGLLPTELGIGNPPLDYGPGWSPLSVIRTLPDPGADPNCSTPPEDVEAIGFSEAAAAIRGAILGRTGARHGR